MNERNKKRVRVRVSVRVRDKIKTPEERKKEKTIIYQKYVYAGDTKTKNIKKKRRNKEIYNNSSEIEKKDFSRIFIFILASNKTSKNIIVIETITITLTLFILMKSSYPTYHNNEIEE